VFQKNFRTNGDKETAYGVHCLHNVHSTVRAVTTGWTNNLKLRRKKKKCQILMRELPEK